MSLLASRARRPQRWCIDPEQRQPHTAISPMLCMGSAGMPLGAKVIAPGGGRYVIRGVVIWRDGSKHTARRAIPLHLPIFSTDFISDLVRQVRYTPSLFKRIVLRNSRI